LQFIFDIYALFSILVFEDKMSLVSLVNIAHNFGDRDIFEKINFFIEKNGKIGFVGKNGSGKTTLLNIIAGKILPHAGTVHLKKNIKIAYLQQEPKFQTDKTLYDFVLESRTDFCRLKEKLQNAEKELSVNNSKANLEKLADLQQQFEMMNGYNFEAELKMILLQLNFPKEFWFRKVNNFSGGEKTRIQLAKILLQPYDVLMMDEPTNHLDIPMIFWLEKYLSNLQKPYVIISHDRFFLDKTVTSIAELKNRKITLYSGNFSFYQKESAVRNELKLKEMKKQQKQIQKMEEQIKRYRIWGRARDSEVMFKRAKELEKRLAKIEVIEKPEKERKTNLKFQADNRSGNDVYRMENLAFGFRDKILGKDINLEIHFRDKISLIGRNGCGKTTFLKILNEEMKPSGGFIKKGANLRIGYYDQLHLKLDNSKTVMETIWQLVPLEPQGYVLSYLAKFGFRGDEVEKSVSVLSGGEKSRLYLAKLIHEKPNFLILDEPTNHLDLDMISALQEALTNYDGTIIFVSHDRFLIENVATKKWFFHQQKIIETDKSVAELFADEDTKKKKKKGEYRPHRTKKTNPIVLQKLEDKIELVQKWISEKQEQILSLEAEFYDPKIYANEQKVKLLNDKLKLLKNEKSGLEIDLERLEEQYLELME